MENTLKQPKKFNNQSLLLMVSTFVRYFGDAFFYVYLSRLLAQKGFTDSKIGIILAITPIVSLICNPMWSYFGKNSEVVRKIFKFLTVIEGIFIILYCHLSNFAILAVLTGCLAIVASPFYNYLDGFSQSFALKNNRDYVQYRMMGSAGYVVATVIGGVVSYFFNGYELLCMFGGVFMLVAAIPFSMLKPINLEVDESKEEVKKRNYKVLFSNKRFWIHVVVYFFTISVSMVGDSYVSLYCERVHNITGFQYGFIGGAMYLLESISLILLLKFGKKLNRHATFILAGVFFFLRSLALYLPLPAPIQISCIVLRGFAWALLVFSNVSIITEIVGEENLTPAIFVIAVGTLVLQSIGNFTFGSLTEAIGYANLYGIISLCVLSAIILKLISWTYYSRKNKKKVSE